MVSLVGNGIHAFQANDATADGSVVVGWADVGGIETAFYWNAVSGTRLLSDVLTNDYDLDVEGWILLSAEGISDDGTALAGRGINPNGVYEAWYARLSTTVSVEQTSTSDVKSLYR